MAHRHLKPEGLFDSQRFGFSQVVAAAPGQTLFVSGQVAWDLDLKVVGEGDLAAQATKALENLGTALAAGGASPADVVSLRIYIVDYEPSHAAVIGPIVAAFFGDSPPSAQTLLGIKALAMPGLMIEIEATAVVPG